MGAFLPGKLTERYAVAIGENKIIMPVPDYERVTPEVHRRRHEIMIRSMDTRLMEETHPLKNIAILGYD